MKFVKIMIFTEDFTSNALLDYQKYRELIRLSKK